MESIYFMQCTYMTNMAAVIVAILDNPKYILFYSRI